MLDVADTAMMLGAGGGLVPGGSAMRRFWRVSERLSDSHGSFQRTVARLDGIRRAPWGKQLPAPFILSP